MQSGAVVSVGGEPAVVSVGTVTDTSIQYVLTGITSGATASRVVQVEPPACALLAADDGLFFGWAVFGVWVLAWGFRVLVRLVKTMLDADAGV